MRELLESFRDWEGDPYEALSIEYVDPTNRFAGVQDHHLLRPDAAPRREDPTA